MAMFSLTIRVTVAGGENNFTSLTRRVKMALFTVKSFSSGCYY